MSGLLALSASGAARGMQSAARNSSEAKKNLCSNEVSSPDASLHTPESKRKQSHLHLSAITLTSQPAPAQQIW